MIDFWHWFGTGADTALLTDVDPREIAGVQLNDGPRVRPDDPDMLHKARSTRWLPGTGELPVRELIAELRTRGYTGTWSVEVNDPWFRALPTDEAARPAFATASAVLALEPGHLILTGALHAAVPLTSGDVFRAEVDRLGPVTVRVS